MVLTSGQSARSSTEKLWLLGLGHWDFCPVIKLFGQEPVHPHLPYSQRNLPVPGEYPGQLQYELVSRSAQGVSPKGQGASSLPHALTNTVFPFC